MTNNKLIEIKHVIYYKFKVLFHIFKQDMTLMRTK